MNENESKQETQNLYEKAVQAGFSTYYARQVTNSFQIAAYKTGALTQTQALNISNDYQILGLLNNKSYNDVLPIEDIEQVYRTESQLEPGRLRGADRKLTTIFAQALQAGFSPYTALSVNNIYQIQAYTTNLISQTDALLFNSPLEVTALIHGMSVQTATQVTNQVQLSAFDTGKVTDVQALLINTQEQVNALALGLPFEEAILVQNQFNALALAAGADIHAALLANNQGQYDAVLVNLEASHNHLYLTNDQLSKITLDTQVSAFQETDLSFDQDLQFTLRSQVEAYKILLNFTQALEIDLPFKLQALQVGMTFDQALQITNGYQVIAYYFNHLTFDQVLQISNNYQVAALNYNVPFEQALLFNNGYQINAYYKCHDLDQALLITTPDLLDNYTC